VPATLLRFKKIHGSEIRATLAIDLDFLTNFNWKSVEFADG